MDQQAQRLEMLQGIVASTPAYSQADQAGDLIKLPTGDGMALVFFGDPQAAARCAIGVASALKGNSELPLRMGLHSGPVYRVADINANMNVAGGGINFAQRVMDCGDAGHILASSTIVDMLRQIGAWTDSLHDLGLAEVKHGVKIHLFNLYNEEAGRKNKPTKLDAAARTSGRARLARTIPLYVAGAAGLVLLVIAVLAYINKAGGGTRLASGTQITSLAVLPLQNLTGDPNQEYFADGMTEELITDLAKISALKVISRTSVMRFKNTKIPLPQIARELGVDGIVEGSVQRSGARVHISAQLIRAATDTHLWGNSYERDAEDVLRLESEIASVVADQIRITVSPEERMRLTTSRRVDPKAYEAYLRGRSYVYNALARDAILQGIEALQHSLALDNTYAPAHAALSVSYQYLAFNGYEVPATAMPKARSAALDALHLDDSLGEAHASLFLVKYLYDLDWAGAEAELKRALELEPNSPIPHQRRAEYLTCNLQQFDEAFREFQRALELDPNSVFIAQELAWNRQMARRWDEAVRDLHKAVALDPSNAPVHGFLAVSLAHLNRRADALAEVEKRLALMPAGQDFAFDYNLIDVYASLGMRQSALTILHYWLEKSAPGPYVDAYIMAEAYGVLGEKELALQWLERAYANRSPQIVFIKIDWALDGLRSDARFQDLLRRMKMPQ